MKKFLIRLLIFALPFIVLAYPLDRFISNGLRKSTYYGMGEAKVWDDIYSGTLNSECLILGSSKAWQHVDPILFEKETGMPAYNLGVDAHNSFMHIFKYEEAIKHNPKPKLIIYSVDVFTLEKRPDLYNQKQFLPFMLWNWPMEEVTMTYAGFTHYDFEIPMIRYIGQYSAFKEGVKSYFKIDPAPRTKGYEGIKAVWNDDLDKAKEHMSSYVIKPDSLSIQLFEEFIKECKQNQIPLALVYTPEYIEGQKFMTGRQNIIDMYNKWSKEYDIPFLDYSNDTLSYQKNYFYNSLHLNKEGSQVFTTRLVDRLTEEGILHKQ